MAGCTWARLKPRGMREWTGLSWRVQYSTVRTGLRRLVNCWDWLMVGSLPCAFLGVLILKSAGGGEALQAHIKLGLGIALVLASAGIIVCVGIIMTCASLGWIPSA